MLIPIGQESNTVRRVPWVTFAIMGLCVIVYILTAGAISEFSYKLEDVKREIHEYYTSHPYLELTNELKKTFFITDEREEIFKSLTEDKSGSAYAEEQRKEEQAYLDNLVEEFNYNKENLPFFKFGLVPKKKTFVGLIGHMFLHVGWLHLLGNLLYLYLLGPFVEDAWGKPAYAVFYLGTGMLAALVFALHYPDSGVPMVGASGAISGVMGGFLIRYWHARIRYFYMFSILVRGTFTAPAWVMLPVGFIMELISASIVDSITPGGGGGVAHWAHVWGFIFGIAGAFLIKFLKIEEKFVAPKVEAQTTYVNKSFVAYEEAMQVLAAGDKEKAFAILMDAAREDSSNQDVIEALWNTALDMGRIDEVTPFLSRLIEREVQQARWEEALSHYRQLRFQVPDTRFSTHTKIKIFQQSINANDREEATSLFKELINEVNLASPPGLVMEFCTAALKFDLNFDQSLAGKVVELALQHPEIPQERKESLKQQLYTIPKQKKDAPIKVGSQYDYDFSEVGSNSDMDGISGASSVSGVSSLIVPPVPTTPKPPLAPQEPLIPVTPFQSQPPPILQEPEIPLLTREPPIPITSPQTQFPPIFEEPTIPIIPQEPEIPLLTQEPTIPMTPSQSQPPPLPIEPVIPVNFQEPEKPIPPPPPAPRKSIRVTEGVPLGIKGGKIALSIKNMGQRVFALEKIKMIAVVKISPPGERPFLLIDLFVDDPDAPNTPTAQPAVIRTLRLLSTNFNPQKFVAGDQGPLEAFKIFTSSLLRLSKSKPFPDLESVQLKKVTGYRSINEYEDSLLCGGGI
jgi:membrane associated rhomboid family serine protease